MRIIEQLAYKITSDTSQFDKGIQTSEKNVSKFSKVAGMALTALSVGAIAGVTKKILSMAQSSATALDRVDKMSQKINISRQSFQEWDFILSQSGASVDGLQMSVKTLSNAASEARDGTKEYSDEFDRLGISVTDTNGNLKDSETLFNEVFLALSDMKDETQRTATASKLLGRSATELAPAMNAGADSIEKMRNQAHDLGLVMSDEAVDAGVALTDSIDQLKRSFKAFSSEALLPVVNLMNTVIQAFLNQDTAVVDLEGAYNDLETAQDNYNKVLDDTKGKSDSVSQSLVEQARAARNLALTQLAQAYRESQKEVSGYEKAIKSGNEWVDKYTNTLERLAEKAGMSTDELNILTDIERTQALQSKLSYQEIGLYNKSLDNRRLNAEKVIESQIKLAEAEKNETDFINLLTSAYIDEEETVGLLLQSYPELRQAVLDNVDVYKEQKRAQEDISKWKDYTVDQLKEEIAYLKQGGGYGESAVYVAEKLALAQELLAEKTGDAVDVLDKEAEAYKRLTDEELNHVIALISADNARERALANSGELSNSYKKEVDGLKAVTEWLVKYEEEISNSTQAVNMLSSIWDNLNEVQANANEAELQRMEEAGASEEELNEKKKQFAREESQRQKAQASFQAIIDTASAVIGFLANPGGWAGVGLSALAVGVGASQIAAINSAPIPSYAVGTIDVPTDRVAQLHAGETVLTKGITEEAKTQGITIAPTGQVGGKNMEFNVYLDGKMIARKVVENVNSGQVGKIDMRVVK